MALTTLDVFKRTVDARLNDVIGTSNAGLDFEIQQIAVSADALSAALFEANALLSNQANITDESLVFIVGALTRAVLSESHGLALTATASVRLGQLQALLLEADAHVAQVEAELARCLADITDALASVPSGNVTELEANQLILAEQLTEATLIASQIELAMTSRETAINTWHIRIESLSAQVVELDARVTGVAANQIETNPQNPFVVARTKAEQALAEAIIAAAEAAASSDPDVDAHARERAIMAKAAAQAALDEASAVAAPLEEQVATVEELITTQTNTAISGYDQSAILQLISAKTAAAEIAKTAMRAAKNLQNLARTQQQRDRAAAILAEKEYLLAVADWELAVAEIQASQLEAAQLTAESDAIAAYSQIVALEINGHAIIDIFHAIEAIALELVPAAIADLVPPDLAGVADDAGLSPTQSLALGEALLSLQAAITSVQTAKQATEQAAGASGESHTQFVANQVLEANKAVAEAHQASATLGAISSEIQATLAALLANPETPTTELALQESRAAALAVIAETAEPILAQIETVAEQVLLIFAALGITATHQSVQANETSVELDLDLTSRINTANSSLEIQRDAVSAAESIAVQAARAAKAFQGLNAVLNAEEARTASDLAFAEERFAKAETALVTIIASDPRLAYIEAAFLADPYDNGPGILSDITSGTHFQKGSILIAGTVSGDPDGDGSITGYRWYRNSNLIQDATASNHEAIEQGVYRVEVDYLDGQGHKSSLSSHDQVITNTDNGIGKISEITSSTGFDEGCLLQAGMISDDPGGINEIIRYQWFYNNSQIAEATAATYEVKPKEAGIYKVVVDYIDSLNNHYSLTSNEQIVSIADNGGGYLSQITSQNGFNEGTRLSAGTISDDPDGDGSIISYQWFHNDNAIQDATSATYDVGSLGWGDYKVSVSYQDSQGFSRNLISSSQAISKSNNGRASFVVDGISGMNGRVKSDSLLSITRTENDPDSNFTDAAWVDWQVSQDTISWETIESGFQYHVSEAHDGKYLRSRIRYTDGQGYEEEVVVDCGTVVSPPKIVSASVAGLDITLLFSKPIISQNITPSIFNVWVAGVKRSVIAVNPDPNDSKNLILSITGTAPRSTQEVEISYIDPNPSIDDPSGVVQGLDGLDMSTMPSTVMAASYTTSIDVTELADSYKNLTLTGTTARIATGNNNSNIILGNSRSNLVIGGDQLDLMDGRDGSDIYMVYSPSEHEGSEIRDTGITGIDELRFASVISGQKLVVFADDTGLERVVVGTGVGSTAAINSTTELSIDASAASSGLEITGNNGKNTLIGSIYTDFLNGNGGIDSMDGGNNRDIYIVTSSVHHTAGEIQDTGTSGIDEVRFAATTTQTLRLFSTDTGIERVSIGTGTGDQAVSSGITALHVNAVEVKNGLSIFGNDGMNIIVTTGFSDYLDGKGGGDVYIVSREAHHPQGEVISDSGTNGIDELRFSSDMAGETIQIRSSDTGLERVSIGTGAGTTAIQTATVALSINASSAPNGLQLLGNYGINTIIGTVYDDLINGSRGNDTLIGGSGKDIFRFDSNLNAVSNRDKIVDFELASDQIELENSVFSALLQTGALSSARFGVGAVASTLDQRIIYNKDLGTLSYDANGSMSGGSIVFAQISAGLELQANSFFVT